MPVQHRSWVYQWIEADGVQASVRLLDCYRDQGRLVINHPQGHVVPRLEGDQFEALQAFLEAQLCPQGTARGML